MTTVEFDQVNRARAKAEDAFAEANQAGEPDPEAAHPGDVWLDVLIAEFPMAGSFPREQVERARTRADYWATDGGAWSEPDPEEWVDRFARELGLDVAPRHDPELVEAVGWALCVHEHGEDGAKAAWQDGRRHGLLEAARVALSARRDHLGGSELPPS